MTLQAPLLEVTVIGCSDLKDTEWVTKQDPYVILEYAGNTHRTKTHKDGGRRPTFNEKFTFPIIEALQEIKVSVWNSNFIGSDTFIGSGKVQLHKVYADGHHDSTWPLNTRSERRAGEIRIILHRVSHGAPAPYQSPMWCPLPNMQHRLPAHGPYRPAHGPSRPPYAFNNYSTFGQAASYWTPESNSNACSGCCSSSRWPAQYPAGGEMPYPQGYPPPGFPQGYGSPSAPLAPPTGAYYS